MLELEKVVSKQKKQIAKAEQALRAAEVIMSCNLQARLTLCVLLVKIMRFAR